MRLFIPNIAAIIILFNNYTSVQSYNCVDDTSVVDGFGNSCADYASAPHICNKYDFSPFFVSQEECCACSCSNNNTITDSFGQTCASYYDTHPESCGDFDTATFEASRQCCACRAHQPSPSLQLTCGATTVASSATTFGLFDTRGQLFTVTVPTLSRTTFSTCLRQTQFDTILHLFQEGNLLEVNDDVEEDATCSTISRLLAPGEYQLLVSGFEGAFGRYGVSMDCNGACGSLLDTINSECSINGCYSAEANTACCDRFLANVHRV